jgi:TFIIF-interacting CTD phosphatase-like protein
VLDLDHTLVHSKEVLPNELRFIREYPRNAADYIRILDDLHSIYEIRMGKVAFHVKFRPFLAEFLKKLHDDGKWEVHYYTAGTNQYGTKIIETFRMELVRVYGG